MKCSFCGFEISKGTGKIYVKKDGTTYFFCAMKCEKNLLKLNRNPVNVEWSMKYAELKQTRLAHSAKA